MKRVRPIDPNAAQAQPYFQSRLRSGRTLDLSCPHNPSQTPQSTPLSSSGTQKESTSASASASATAPPTADGGQPSGTQNQTATPEDKPVSPLALNMELINHSSLGTPLCSTGTALLSTLSPQQPHGLQLVGQNGGTMAVQEIQKDDVMAAQAKGSWEAQNQNKAELVCRENEGLSSSKEAGN